MTQDPVRHLVELYQQGRLRDVVKAGARLAAARPDLLLVHNVMGAAHGGLGQFEEALASFRNAARLAPNSAETHANLGVVYMNMGRSEDAAASFQTVVRLKPNDVQALVNLGAALQSAGDLTGAEAVFEKAVALQPQSAAALANLALAQKDQGKLDAAVKSFSAAVGVDPSDPVAQSNLAAILSEAGETAQAIRHYREALRLKPDMLSARRALGGVLGVSGALDEACACYEEALAQDGDDAETLSALGLMLRRLGRRDAAAERFRRAAEIEPANPAHMNNLGRCLSETGALDEAAEALDAAIRIRPNYPSANANLANLRTRQVPLWHVHMMNDAPRNAAFEAALKTVIKPGDDVLEIGTGSGLLAMMAADAGAGSVVTCEVEPSIAQAAATVIEKNGKSQDVKVLARKSTALRVPDDLEKRADVIVAEILSSEFVGEDIVATLRDARRRLLAPGGRMVPAGGAIMVALLAETRPIQEKLYAGDSSGYDLSPFNEVTARKQSLHLDGADVRLLSSPIAAFTFDFYDPNPKVERETVLQLTATSAGACLGVIQWNRADLADDVVYENDPRTLRSHWSTPIYLLDRPRHVQAGETIAVEGALSEDNVWFSMR